jgi:hypothetical protein
MMAVMVMLVVMITMTVGMVVMAMIMAMVVIVMMVMSVVVAPHVSMRFGNVRRRGRTTPIAPEPIELRRQINA